MKKFFAILLALVMALSLGAAVFAEGGTPAGEGSITIDNAVLGQTYTVYKVFDVTYSLNDDGTTGSLAYTYTATGADDPFLLALQDELSPFTAAATMTENVYGILLKEGRDAAAVSAWIKAQIEANLLTATAAKEATESPLVFNNIPYGYYYITTANGAAVTIDTAAPDVTVQDKQDKPSLVKQAWNDPYWLDYNVGSIGDEVKFKVEAYVPKYDEGKPVQTYVFSDYLDDGLTFTEVTSVAIRDSQPADENGEFVWHELTDDQYGVSSDGPAAPSNGFRLSFDTNLTDGAGWEYPANANVKIEYTAMINGEAVLKNINKVEMNWIYEGGEPGGPLEDHTTTWVFGFDLIKFYKDSEGTEHNLTGAEFTLWDTADYTDPNGKQIKVTYVNTDEDGVNCYRVLTDEEVAANYPAASNIKAGKAQVFGLAPGVYWLQEEVTPDGYNPLTERQRVYLSNETHEAETHNGINAHIKVENKTGSELPSTGGIGTTIFYVIGGLLMVGAAVLLIVRRKMSVED